MSKTRTDLLTTDEMHKLDSACAPIRAAFGRPPYLVGTAGIGGAESYRDVDVRLMLDDDDFAAACPTRERWELLSLSIGAYLRDRTGLPIDFQVQRTKEANEWFGDRPRNPLGMGRIFAGGGDATPDWVEAVPAGDKLIREILEVLCRRDGLSLESGIEPGEAARNYELATRLGIGHVFGLKESDAP